MKLRILSDGTIPGTRVMTDRGEEIEQVTALRWEIDVRDRRTATVFMMAHEVEADIRGDEIEDDDEGMGTEPDPPPFFEVTPPWTWFLFGVGCGITLISLVLLLGAFTA